MFEARVLYLLRQYLGEYVHGLSAEALKISVWKGDVVLKDLQLKAEALNSLKLPIIVKAGFLGFVTLKVPWNRLGKDPVIVLLDRIFILAEPIQDEKFFKEEDKQKLFEAKRRHIEELELAMLDAKVKKPETSLESRSWLGSLVATIVGNLKISITNVHIRYEDSVSNPGKPFCSGVTLAKLAAVTIDDNGLETFVASGALDRLHKSLQLQRFAIYHDSSCNPWKVDKNWEDLTPEQWSEMFEAGINQDSVKNAGLASKHQFLLQPVDGILQYLRRSKREKRAPDVPFQKISLTLNEVSLSVSEGQYCDGLKVLEEISRYRKRIELFHLRPHVAILENPRAWWVYACQAGLLQQKKTWSHFSWKSVVHLCQLRRKYVHLYSMIVQQNLKAGNTEIQEMEKELDAKVVLLWRLLAHAKVESSRSKEATLAREKLKKSKNWWSFGWGATGSLDSETEDSSVNNAVEPGRLTKEEWKKINELLSFEPGEESPFFLGQESPDMLQISFDATVGQSALRILDSKMLEIICGKFENLRAGFNLYPKTIECHTELQFYGLSAPEGSLMETISKDGKEQAVAATFVYCPLDGGLDWKLSATISPCYVTVWLVSFTRVVQFLRSSNAISPDFASETAAVLQNKLEQATRRAQEQLQLALEEQRRFSIDLDLDAPKVMVPFDSAERDGDENHFLLDLGRFTLHTINDDEAIKRNRYSRFYVSGSQISAFFIDGISKQLDMKTVAASLESCDKVNTHIGTNQDGQLNQESQAILYPILDRCGMRIIFDQIRAQDPSLPSTSVAIEVPHLGLHFSPTRYDRLMQLFAAFEGFGAPMGGQSLWYPADHSGEALVLLWKGFGNTVAEWQPCWAVLAGSYLYILESANAETYQRCSSLDGKQVLDVPTANVGGSDHVIAICNRGVDLQKALESSNTVVLQLQNDEHKSTWLRYLTLAIYGTSAPASLYLPEELGGNEAEYESIQPENTAEHPLLFVTGSLDELKVCIYGLADFSSLGSSHETLILELQACGGKVNVLQRLFDLTVGMKLHALKVEDMLMGGISRSCQYIARSVLSKPGFCGLDIEEDDKGDNSNLSSLGDKNVIDDDHFKDSLTEFGYFPDSEHSLNIPRVHSDACFSKSMSSSLESDPMNSPYAALFLSKICGKIDEDASDFVSMHFISRQVESPYYDGNDVQMGIRMATLDFFCNRPTVVALINFGIELSELGDTKGVSTSAGGHVAHPSKTEAFADYSTVKGLLGQGKSRVLFWLRMHIDSVRIFLNKEDGSQLAMLAQERFQLNLKVFPDSFIVAGTLGNLRVCDLSLGPDHPWGWVCDIRDPGCDSLVKLEFYSFSTDEEGFEEYDYKLVGKLSTVRIVFLYRFIQEVTAYFVALATPQAQQAIRVVDVVGGIERLIPQSDVTGSAAVKLDIAMDSPLIIMPRNSSSKEFMQLDLGHLQIMNSFEWYGGGRDVPSAVRLDVLLAEVTGINMVVGINGVAGKPMIQEAKGFHVIVRRPLRDMFKRVPELQVEVQVDMLRGIMSDKEYLVITECSATNIAETPNLPPYFRHVETEFSMMNATDKALQVNKAEIDNSSERIDVKLTSSAWTTTRINLEIQYADLELYTGFDREMALARAALQGFWLSYRCTSAQEMDIFVTLPKLSVLDLRADTVPEMRLMFGSMVDVEKNEAPALKTGYLSEELRISQHGLASPHLTMLMMDLRTKPESQTLILRVQRPRLLVVLDFLFAVAEFFVPSLGAVTGKEDTMKLSNDPILRHGHIRLTTPVYKQLQEVVTLSRNKRLLVDYPDCDEFIYDGCGGSIYLDICEESPDSSGLLLVPLISIAPGKRLCFKNIRIKDGFRLNECLQLSCNSSYSVNAEDEVILEAIGDSSMQVQSGSYRAVENFVTASNFSAPTMSGAVSNFILDVQAIAPEFTFYDSARSANADLPGQEKLVRARMNFHLMYASKESDRCIHGIVKGFDIEGGSGLSIVDPVDLSIQYACVKDKTSIVLSASDIYVRLSFSLIRLLHRLHIDLISTHQFGNSYILSRCTHFDQIWAGHAGNTSTQRIAVWRPKAPSGYAILGDCITSGEAPPSQAVMALSNLYCRVKRPSHFELVGPLTDDFHSAFEGSFTSNSASLYCQIWRPVPSPGYVALGCIAGIGSSPPSLSDVHCVRADLVTSTTVSDCIFYVPPDPRKENREGFSIWRIDNIVGSFFGHSSTKAPPRFLLYDLRELLQQTNSNNSVMTDLYRPEGQCNHSQERILEATPPQSEYSGIRARSGCYYTTTAKFECMWWDKGNDPSRAVSIWRPIPALGYAIIGDSITEGLEPPSFGLVLRDDSSGHLAKPVRYIPRMHIACKGSEDILIWYPVAPRGYVSLGCVLSRTEEAPSIDLMRCVRLDLVNEVNISNTPIWSNLGSKDGYSCSLWRVENQQNTFLARPDLKRPPARLGFGLIEAGKQRIHENLTAELKLGRLSVTAFDDLRGLMIPLADMTITSVNLAAHGRVEALNVVMLSSLAASTFNPQLESWEPLIEPFEGIFKYESYDSTAEMALKVGRRIRMTAANIVNLNITSANVEALLGAVLAWKKQVESDVQALKARQLDDGVSRKTQRESHIGSALDENGLEKLILENKLGQDLYIRTYEHEFKNCLLLDKDGTAFLHLPPPKFPYMLSSRNFHTQHRHVAIHISEARDLLINDDGNGQDYLCSLRLATTKYPLQEQKILTQSARSRCVKPSAVQQNGSLNLATAAWNEMFIFDIPETDSANLEVVVSNQAAKGGKGEIVGILSLPIKEASNEQILHPSSLWRHVQRSFLRGSCTSWPSAQAKTFTLLPPKRKASSNIEEDETKSCGYLTIGMYFFTTNPNWHLQEVVHKDSSSASEVGFWVAGNPDGTWTSIRSILPLGTVPLQISNSYVVLEINMRQAQKHALIRGTVTVLNNTDAVVEVCVCPAFLLSNMDENTLTRKTFDVADEEIFENQRFQPLAGWGSKWPGHLLPTDPSRWSTRDYTRSSQTREEFESLLPLGWIWLSDWEIDKAGYVDEEGWAYGTDFQSLKWPPVSARSCRKSAFDFTRRRRWVRRRQRIPDSGPNQIRQTSSIIQPGNSTSLPWAYTASHTDYCMQVRPYCTPSEFLWGRPSNVYPRSTSSQSSNRNSPRLNKNGFPVSMFMLSQLEKTEELLLCPALYPSLRRHQWLSIEADADILYADLNSPIYDWRLTVNAPLKLENLLPCAARYIIKEKTKEGKLIERDQGVLSAGSNVYIYFVDIRTPVFLSWFIPGGWKPEKEVLLISGQLTEELPSGFLVIQQLTGRRLRLSLERDLGSTEAAAKVVRIFVPYWLCNKSTLPLLYSLVEIEPSRGLDNESPWLIRAVKAAKQAAHRPSHESDRRRSKLHNVIQVLEVIENTGNAPVMLSPQAQTVRTGFLPFSPRAEDGMLSPRLGFSVSVSDYSNFSSGVSFRDLDNGERVGIKAVDANRAYYKLSAFLDMSSERTKVVNIQPHILFVNRLGQRLFMRQSNIDYAELFHPNDPPKSFLWRSIIEPESLRICIDGFRWSNPFSVDCEGTMHIMMCSEQGGCQFLVRVEIRNGLSDSRFLVIFRRISLSSPYRIENRSAAFPIRFRQASSAFDSWQLLQPGSALPFCWEDLGKEHLLEILIDGVDPSSSRKYIIDEAAEYQPLSSEIGPMATLHVTVFRENAVQVIRLADWLPQELALPLIHTGTALIPQHLKQRQSRQAAPRYAADGAENQFHVSIELAEFGLSMVDHTPEELLYLSAQNLFFMYATGLGSGASRLKLRVDALQIDNQLPLTPMTVLLKPPALNQPDCILKCTITIQDNGSSEQYLYPYIGIQGPCVPNAAIHVNIHEPFIWRLHEMIRRLNLSRLTGSHTTHVAIDPIIHIGLLNISEIRFKVSLCMSPTQRPRGVLGFWASLMSALGNTDDMPITIAARVYEDIRMRQSALVASAISNLRKDILSHPLQLLTGMDILGNASSAFGHMSKGVAELSMDKKFIKSRQKQESKSSVEGFGDGFREGAGAFGRGLLRGVTGILTKPLEGAKSSGVEGFVQGVGKGIIGVAAQPMSGMLDLLSKTTEGANAMRMRISAAIMSEEQLLRHRLPRVIGGDNILRLYDDYKAQGQVLMQLAERGAIFGPMDFFKIRGKFAMTDAYEDHFNLPKGRTLIITHRRVMLLQHPTNLIVQKKPDLLKDPCTILWDVTWNDLITMELIPGKGESENTAPSRLILYLRNSSQDVRIFDSKDLVRVVKCHSGSNQAQQIYAAIQYAMDSFGPNRTTSSLQIMEQRKVKKPYAATETGIPSEGTFGLFHQSTGPISIAMMETFDPLLGIEN